MGSTMRQHVVDVIIVGGGVAGLTAAKTLLSYKGISLKVVVLEALPEAGGRASSCTLHSFDDTKYEEDVYDAGASWVHGMDEEESTTCDELKKQMTSYEEEFLKQMNLLEHGILDTSIKESCPWICFDETNCRVSDDLILKAYQSFESALENLKDDSPKYDEFFQRHFNKNVSFNFLLLSNERLFNEENPHRTATPLSVAIEAELQTLLSPSTHDISETLRNSIRFMEEAASEYNAIKLSDCNQKLYMLDEDYWGKQIILKNLKQSIVDPLVESIDEDVLLVEHAVDLIRWKELDEEGNQTIIVQTKNNKVFRAPYMILALPLGVLKEELQTLFTPPLPIKKQNCIQNIGYGLFNKLFLRFNQPFWCNDYNSAFIGVFGEELVDGRGASLVGGGDVYTKHIFERVCIRIVNLWYYFDVPVLTIYFYGEAAEALEYVHEEEVIDVICKRLEKCFGVNIEVPKTGGDTQSMKMRGDAVCLDGWYITKWRSNPYFRGSFSTIQCNTTLDDLITFQQPIDECIYFCGEAASIQHIATVKGAYDSGAREANKILQKFK